MKLENCERGREKDLFPIPRLADFSKRFLSISTGINLPQTCSKQAATINDATTKHGSSEYANESTVPVTQRTPTKQITSLETEQVNMSVVLTENFQSFHFMSYILGFRPEHSIRRSLNYGMQKNIYNFSVHRIRI